MPKATVKEDSQKDSPQNPEQETISKLKGSVDALNSALIRVNALQEKIGLLEKKCSELDKISALMELMRTLVTKVDELDKNMANALKTIHSDNETANKALRGQQKKLSDKLNECFSIKIWKLPEMNSFSLIIILFFLLMGYQTLLHLLF